MVSMGMGHREMGERRELAPSQKKIREPPEKPGAEHPSF